MSIPSYLLAIVALSFLVSISANGGDDGFPYECNNTRPDGQVTNVDDCTGNSIIGASTDYISTNYTTLPSTTLLVTNATQPSTIVSLATEATNAGILSNSTAINSSHNSALANGTFPMTSTTPAPLNVTTQSNSTVSLQTISTFSKQNNLPINRAIDSGSSANSTRNSTVFTPASVPTDVRGSRNATTKSAPKPSSSSALVAVNVLFLIVLSAFSAFVL